MIARSLFIDWWNPFFLFDPHQLIINPHLWLAQSAFLDSYSKSQCFLLIHGRPRTSWVANPHLSLVHCLFYDCQVPIFSLVTSSFTVGKSQYRWSKYQFYFLQSAFLDGCVLILYVLRKTSKSNFHGVIPLFPAVLMWSPYKPQVPVALSCLSKASQSFSYFLTKILPFHLFFRISLSLPNVLCKPPNCCYICYCKSPSNDAKIIISITLKLSVSASLVGSEIISAPKLKTELILTVSRRSLGLGRQLQFPWRFKKITFCFLVVRTAETDEKLHLKISLKTKKHEITNKHGDRSFLMAKLVYWENSNGIPPRVRPGSSKNGEIRIKPSERCFRSIQEMLETICLIKMDLNLTAWENGDLNYQHMMIYIEKNKIVWEYMFLTNKWD